MFTTADFESRLRSTPFIPFRMVTSSGEAYEIHHPNLVIIGDHFLMIGIPYPTDATVARRISRVVIAHITAMEDIPVTQQEPASAAGVAGLLKLTASGFFRKFKKNEGRPALVTVVLTGHGLKDPGTAMDYLKKPKLVAPNIKAILKEVEMR